jgi:hypothetical protein
MAFGDSKQRKGSEGGRTESPYIKLAAGERVIRIRDDEEFSYWRYFINVNVNGQQQGRSIVVAMDNPIKKMMDQLGADHPNFRKVERRMLLNVLDRTPVVRWTDGTTLYPDQSGVFTNPESGTRLSDPARVANNRPMILDFGPQLMEFFMAYHNRLRNKQNLDELLPIQRVDLRVATFGKGFDTKRIVTADQDTDPLPPELAALPKYDLKKLTQPMPNEAIQQLLDGADYNEVTRALGWERVQPLW